MSWIVDTDVISELTKKRPDPHVREWILDQPEQTLFLSVITVAELRKGILLRGPGKKTADLLAWWERVVNEEFVDRLLPFDAEIAVRWADMNASALKAGYRLPILDSQIAATAVYNGMTVVSRNVADFELCGAAVVSPWSG